MKEGKVNDQSDDVFSSESEVIKMVTRILMNFFHHL